MEALPIDAAPSMLYVYLIMSASMCPVLGTSIASSNEMGEGRLVTTLTSVDRAKVRPTMDYTKPTSVMFQFTLIHIKELNMAKQELTLTGAFTVMWNDPFLTWNISDFDNIYFTRIPVSSIWTPSLFIANSANGGDPETEWRKGEVTVLHDGNITWSPSGVITTACDVDVFSFPFDTQKCNLSVFPWRTTENEVIYTGGYGRGVNGAIENWEWKILNSEVKSLKHFSSHGKTTFVVFSFTFERQPLYYVTTLILPIVVLFFVGLLVFPLPADSGEKVSLSVACLMSFFLTQLVIAEEIPRSLKSVPVIMIFNIIFMLLNVLSVSVTVLVLNLHHRQAVNVPRWLEWILEQRSRRKMTSENKVESCDMKILDVPSTEVEEVKYNVMSGNGKKSVTSLLSSILEVVQKAADDTRNHVDEGEAIKKKWRDVADAVNTVLCGLYIFVALLKVIVIVMLWM